METLGSIVLAMCVMAAIGAQIWLILIIMRGSPFAALLCLVVPFLVLFFIRDHWEVARKPILVWACGLIGIIPAAILIANG